MKKIIISLSGAAVVLCGCNKSNTDTAKIEALSQQINVILKNQYITISNQFVLFNEVASVKTQVTNEMVLINGLFTDTGNLITLEGLNTKAIESHVDEKFNSAASAQTVMNELLLNSVGMILTNTATVTARPQPNDVDRVLKIERQSDFEQMKEDVGEIQENLRKIKERLGIIN